MRSDGGDGTPSHRTLPFLAATSHTNGRTWSRPAALPNDMLAAYPKALVLQSGVLLLTAGRPGSDLWASLDGLGKAWQRYSLPTYHNRLIATAGLPDSWKACDQWVAAAANHTFAGSPVPAVDDKPDGGPMTGWISTSGYNAIVAMDPDSALQGMTSRCQVRSDSAS